MNFQPPEEDDPRDDDQLQQEAEALTVNTTTSPASQPQALTDAQALLQKYKALCIENSRGDGYHLARIDKAIAALAARPAAAGVPEKYDDTLLPFLTLMRTELHANSRKGDRPGWLAMSREAGLLEIYWHTAKLSAAVKNDDAPLIAEHAADVANMAMMLLDVCGGLATDALAPQTATQPASDAVEVPAGTCINCGATAEGLAKPCPKWVNQCDGCAVAPQANRFGNHDMPDGSKMACTAYRYATPAQPAPAPGAGKGRPPLTMSMFANLEDFKAAVRKQEQP